MDIDFASVQLDVDIDGSKPDTDISLDGRWAALHLTRNADPIINGHRVDDRSASAINIAGSVDVKFGPRESVANWSFRFIQLVAHMESYALYYGRAAKDGYVSIDMASPPGVPQKFAYDFMLDSAPEIFGARVMPFTNLRDPVVAPKRNRQNQLVSGVSLIMTDMDDHPSRRMTTVFKNKETRADNYLAEALDQKMFLTAFVARNEGTKTITPLAYVTWQVEWRAKYRWVDGECRPYGASPPMKVDTPVKGGLTQPAIIGRTGASMALKITNPTTDRNETANTIARNAAKALDDHPQWWNVDHGKKWPASVPADFWT